VSAAERNHPFKMLAGCADMLNGVPLDRDDFVATLTHHALVEIRCDHEAKTDTPVCNCARVALGLHPSVQAAKEAWAGHVWDSFHASPSFLPGDKEEKR
jgi:hypothetical protein